MKVWNLILEVHREVTALDEGAASDQAERLRQSVESHCGDCSVYVESVEEAGS